MTPREVFANDVPEDRSITCDSDIDRDLRLSLRRNKLKRNEERRGFPSGIGGSAGSAVTVGVDSDR